MSIDNIDNPNTLAILDVLEQYDERAEDRAVAAIAAQFICTANATGTTPTARTVRRAIETAYLMLDNIRNGTWREGATDEPMREFPE